MKKVWFDEAWEDFEYWTQQDKKTMKKAGKKVISAMDSAESMIAKKIN